MYRWFHVFAFVCPIALFGQSDSTAYEDAYPDTFPQSGRVNVSHSNRQIPKIFQLFSTGEIDYISGGMLRSSARLAEINIGDPERFYIPLYIMAGATTNPTEEGYSVNTLSAAEILNNYGGMFSIGIHGSHKLKTISKTTKLDIIYQVATKSMSGIALELDETVSLFSKMMVMGLGIDTKAWKIGQLPSDGRAWLKCYISYSMNNREEMQKIFGCSSDHRFAGA
nr:hypothetical protein [Saprospiraceae bacterium]